MRDMNRPIVAVAALLAAWCAASAAEFERIFRAPRCTRGSTGVLPVQPIDQAAWIAHPDDADMKRLAPQPRAVRYRCRFESDGSPLTVDVTGDERFLLLMDGEQVARGPHRGTVENWMYQTYRISPSAGEHVMEAVVWSLGPAAPLAQFSYRPGFCLKADGAYDAVLTTGRGKWKCGAPGGIRSIGRDGGPWGLGDAFELAGSGAPGREPQAWVDPAVVRPSLGKGSYWGSRQRGWMLFPSQLPDQVSERVRPGRFVSGAEMKFPMTVPAGETRTILWDLGRYYCAYPEAVVKGGRGGSMTWKWAESLRGPSPDPSVKGEFKGDRAAWKGKRFEGFGDRFAFDGRSRASFQPPWFRCGRWCEIVVRAGDEPVVVEDLRIEETRYPLECKSVFEAPDDPALADVQRICVRSMQMCCHEMLFDCPYYEQQMYPGDSRVQLDVISAMTPDDRIIRRVVDIYALNRRDDGMVPFNYPTTGTQEGASYTLCYLLMFSDYAANHVDGDWLRARLPAMRDTLGAFELYERADGVVQGLPGWNFMDWVPRPGWEGGWAPGARDGGASAELNLFYLLALQGAARVESAFGNRHLAAHWSDKAARLKPAVVNAFFDGKRGLFASDAGRTVFSEHAQCLALLADVFDGARAQALFDALVSAKDLCPTSIYFKFYLFETYFKFGRPDLFLDALGLWKDHIAKNLTTCIEEPEWPGHETRSDCHAWGAHPLWFLRTGVAGIRSDAPFFARVKVAPQPGPLKSFKASYPHPSGKMIEAELKFDGGRAAGVVTTPVAGTFVYGGETVELKPGRNEIGRK